MSFAELAKKTEAELTEEERTALKGYVEAYRADIAEVDKKHGMETYAVLTSNESGIYAGMRVRAVKGE